MTTTIVIPLKIWAFLVYFSAAYCFVQAAICLFKMTMYHSYAARNCTWIQAAYFVCAIFFEAGCYFLLTYANKL